MGMVHSSTVKLCWQLRLFDGKLHGQLRFRDMKSLKTTKQIDLFDIRRIINRTEDITFYSCRDTTNSHIVYNSRGIKRTCTLLQPISYPEFSGFLVSCWVAGETLAGVLEFCYRKISAVKQCKPLLGSQAKKIFFSNSPVCPGAHSLTKNPEDS